MASKKNKTGSPGQRIGVFAGSFDPITLGHCDIIDRALAMVDHLIVAVGHSPSKLGLFTPSERLALISAVYKNNRQLTVASYTGLTTTFAKSHGASLLIRSTRDSTDFDLETRTALMNRQLAPEIETVILVARPEYAGLSSSLVKEIHAMGGDIRKFVPVPVQKALQQKLRP
jgi:pantetheine-phosphate adenylyltransferase